MVMDTAKELTEFPNFSTTNDDSQDYTKIEADPEGETFLEPKENKQNVSTLESATGTLDLELNSLTEGKEVKDNFMSSRELFEKFQRDEEAEDFTEIERTEEYEEENFAVTCDEYCDREDDGEEIYPAASCTAGREKLVEEVAEENEEAKPDRNNADVLVDISVEILRDRDALVDKLRELNKDKSELRRKNRVLQYWVARLMTKKHQTMTPEDESLGSNDTEDRYNKKLSSYKMTVDEMAARQEEIKVELGILENNLTNILKEDSETFSALLDREREVGVGLIFEKSGRVFSVNAVEAMIRRQILRRDLVARTRVKFILYRNHHEDLKRKLRVVETLGEGMTIMDYERIRVENDAYREKVEERDENLDKLFFKIQEMLNILANYKEKIIVNEATIRHEKNRFEVIKSEALKTRKIVTKVHQDLSRIRNAWTDKKKRAGLLNSLPVIREMEKTLKNLNDLKVAVQEMVPQVRSYLNEDRCSVRGGAVAKLEVDETRTTVTRMTKVKRSEPRKRPGRC